MCNSQLSLNRSGLWIELWGSIQISANRLLSYQRQREQQRSRCRPGAGGGAATGATTAASGGPADLCARCVVLVFEKSMTISSPSSSSLMSCSGCSWALGSTHSFNLDPSQVAVTSAVFSCVIRLVVSPSTLPNTFTLIRFVCLHTLCATLALLLTQLFLQGSKMGFKI